MLASARRRSVGFVLTLVLALVGAPAWSALRNTCDICPRSCPMHEHGRQGASKATAHMKCHGAPAGHAEDQPSTTGRSPAVTRATCGNHGVMASTVLPPMLLPAALPRLAVPAAQRAALSITTGHARNADPPDTPPPIVAA
jgi:hypothetical protein